MKHSFRHKETGAILGLLLGLVVVVFCLTAVSTAASGQVSGAVSYKSGQAAIEQSNLSPQFYCPPTNVPTWPVWGAVIVPASNWGGVDVYSNGGNVNNGCIDGCGRAQYQCVELDIRFYQQHYGGPCTWSNINCAYDMFTNHPSTLTAIQNGGSPRPQWGDLLIFGGPNCGHTAVITSVSSTQVSFVEQNWTMWGQYSLPIDSNNFIADRGGGYYVLGWLRHNGSANTPTRTPTNVPPNPTYTRTRTATPAAISAS